MFPTKPGTSADGFVDIPNGSRTSSAGSEPRPCAITCAIVSTSQRGRRRPNRRSTRPLLLAVPAPSSIPQDCLSRQLPRRLMGSMLAHRSHLKTFVLNVAGGGLCSSSAPTPGMPPRSTRPRAQLRLRSGRFARDTRFAAPPAHRRSAIPALRGQHRHRVTVNAPRTAKNVIR